MGYVSGTGMRKKTLLCNTEILKTKTVSNPISVDNHYYTYILDQGERKKTDNFPQSHSILILSQHNPSFIRNRVS